MATAQHPVGKSGTAWYQYAGGVGSIVGASSGVPLTTSLGSSLGAGSILSDVTAPITSAITSDLKTVGLWLLAIALVITGLIILFRDASPSLPSPPVLSPSSPGGEGEADMAEAGEVAA